MLLISAKILTGKSTNYTKIFFFYHQINVKPYLFVRLNRYIQKHKLNFLKSFKNIPKMFKIFLKVKHSLIYLVLTVYKYT